MIRVVELRLAQTRRPAAPGVTRYRLSKRVPCMWMVQTLPMAMPHAHIYGYRGACAYFPAERRALSYVSVRSFSAGADAMG